MRQACQGDKRALTAVARRGHPERLSAAQQRETLGWLRKSPLEFGYATGPTAGQAASVVPNSPVCRLF